MGETDYTTILGDQGNVRLRVQIRTSGGGIKAFVIQLETLHAGEWHPFVRYDNAHGFFHRDEIDVTGRTSKTEINLPDAKTAVAYAVQDLADRWDWYRDRFLSPQKKGKRR